MIRKTSIGRGAEAVTVFVAGTAIAILRLSRMTADELFWAIDFVALAKICRRVKSEIFDFYRPELHYMRGPGPKWREKYARDDRTVSSPR